MGTHDILIVDDDEPLRAALAEVLETQGFAVRQAGDGREALRIAADRPPRLILLDLTMPEMDGWSTLRELQSHPELSRIPVVIVSAEPVCPQDCRTVTKPYEIGRLLEVIRDSAAGQ